MERIRTCFEVATINDFVTNGITFIQDQFVAGGSLQFPVGSTSTNPAFFGPNFAATEVSDTPEPASMMLIGSGLAGLGLVRFGKSSRS